MLTETQPIVSAIDCACLVRSDIQGGGPNNIYRHRTAESRTVWFRPRERSKKELCGAKPSLDSIGHGFGMAEAVIIVDRLLGGIKSFSRNPAWQVRLPAHALHHL